MNSADGPHPIHRASGSVQGKDAEAQDGAHSAVHDAPAPQQPVGVQPAAGPTPQQLTDHGPGARSRDAVVAHNPAPPTGAPHLPGDSSPRPWPAPAGPSASGDRYPARNPSAPTWPAPFAAGPPDTPAVFAPPADTWRRLSPRLITVRRLTSTLVLIVLTAVLAASTWFFSNSVELTAVVAGIGIAGWIWQWIRIARVVHRWGYAERDADLCITHGLWFKELIVVPFGRMQVVRVTSGPLTRAFGLASVQLVTASPATGASIPGLPLEEARELRDRIIELSDAKGSGL